MRHGNEPEPRFHPLIVIPCLNEVGHLEAIVREMASSAARVRGRVVVVDGGSTDGSIEMAHRLAEEHDNVSNLENPARLQSAGINAAVRAFGEGYTHVLRVDAHAAYPPGFVDALGQESRAVDAASIVVGMVAEGNALLQRINASTQNSRIGNGGSQHRFKGTGRFVDHGHHALMRMDAFRAVGGYDESFSHNEDAELDYRLAQAGHRIWLTGATHVGYYPRKTLGALARQYVNYGKGRARNLLKHRTLPRLRQAAVIAVGPVFLAAMLAPAHPGLAAPALIWAFATILGGCCLALLQREPLLVLSGPIALVMHLSWSYGFWRQALGGAERGARA